MKKMVRSAMRMLYLITRNSEQLYNSPHNEDDGDGNIHTALPTFPDMHEAVSCSKLIRSSEYVYELHSEDI